MNRTLGDSIVGTDDFLHSMHKVEEDVMLYDKRKLNLSIKNKNHPSNEQNYQ